MEKITVTLSGGLGNQMFQYAAGYALAKKWHKELALDTSSYRFDNLRQFGLAPYGISDPEAKKNLAPQDYVTHGLKPKLKKMMPAFAVAGLTVIYKNTAYKLLRLLQSRTVYFQSAFHFDDGFFNRREIKKIVGIFQSDHYFQGAENDIRQAFSLKEALSLSAKKIEEKIASAPQAVSLHVRRSDYLNAQNAATYGSVALDYYHKAIKIMTALASKETAFFIFTDDVGFVKNNFHFLPGYTLVSDMIDDQHEELHLMSKCAHHIIANSTYSWWGAWLNPSSDKIVIAPRRWFRDAAMRVNNITDIYPKDWILI